MVDCGEQLEPFLLGPHLGVHHVGPLAVAQVEPPLLGCGVLILGLDPSLRLSLRVEEHSLSLAVDFAIGDPLKFAPLSYLFDLHVADNLCRNRLLKKLCSQPKT